MKFLDEIKNYSTKKVAIPLLGALGLFGTYRANAQEDPQVTNRSTEGIKTTCELLFADFNNDGYIDEIEITKDQKNNQIAIYLRKGDEEGNLINFPKPHSGNNHRPVLKINWNSKTYIKAIINNFDNNNIKDIKFLTRDEKGIKQYNFYGDGNGKFTNNSNERHYLIPVQN